MQTVLIIEDERAIAELLKYSIEKEGMQVILAGDGKTAFEIIDAVRPDLILLDLMLPDIDGMDICREVTDKKDIPVIIVSAKNDQMDKLIGLENGADDYITKPFDIREVILRIRSVLRRSEKLESDSELLTVRDIMLDTGKHTVFRCGKKIELTPKEFALLEMMMRNKDQVLSRGNILKKVWGFDYVGDTRTVDIHIQRLRKKLDDEKAILTLFGVGYKMTDQDA